MDPVPASSRGPQGDLHFQAVWAASSCAGGIWLKESHRALGSLGICSLFSLSTIGGRESHSWSTLLIPKTRFILVPLTFSLSQHLLCAF